MFVETNSTLLVVTIVVSILHLLFDLLAFKNDITFWSSLESTKGISVRSVAVQTAMELVVFLYLIDNETSILVLITVGGTILVNLWKLFRSWQLSNPLSRRAKAAATAAAASAKSDGKGPGGKGSDKDAAPPPAAAVAAADEAALSEQELSAKFDGIASQYLLLILGPAIVGYAAYSLLYEKHKGWYSWGLESGVNVVYAVGFMMMTPQLFLNYQYKSVDHLPWKALIYRALNTFIDDLFAFVITMPGLHRVAVFRDDVVFFIYLYQRWIYRTRRPAPGTPAAVAAAGASPEKSDREALLRAGRTKGREKKGT